VNCFTVTEIHRRGNQKTSGEFDQRHHIYTGNTKTLAFNFTYFLPRVTVQAGGDGQRSGAGNNLGGTKETEPAYIALREALNGQLGVTLKTGRVQARFLAIDHAEEPSKN
jgi:hypothetical protein